tara:strand:- start:547 stop:783 length:237 start_codon:yes stop_codon:yes gene_type:complete
MSKHYNKNITQSAQIMIMKSVQNVFENDKGDFFASLSGIERIHPDDYKFDSEKMHNTLIDIFLDQLSKELRRENEKLS